jgi:hypothetical protein
VFFIQKEREMADPIKLSRPYDTRDKAAMGGFREVMANSTEVEHKEYAFWVILKVSGKEVKYHYSTPETDSSSDGVTLKYPVGHIVRAFCHTHPKSISTGNFSPGDLRQFKELAEKTNINIVFYLLNPQQQIRLAENEKDFTAGKSVAWLSE